MNSSVRIAIITLLTLGSALGLTQSARGFEINPELKQFEKTVETKILDNIRLIYGANTQAAISVSAVEDKKGTDKKTPTEDNDVGYAPFAFVDDQGVVDLGVKHLSITSMSVQIQVPEETDNAVGDGIKELVTTLLKEFTPTVQVTKLKVVKQTPTDANDKAKPTSKWEMLKLFLPYITALIAALILSLGVLFIAGALKATAQSIIDGLHDTRANVSVSTNKPALLEISGDNPGANNNQPNSGKAEEPKEANISPISSLKDYARNIELIQQALKENPPLFMQTLQDTSIEWQGLKSLLPCLNGEEQQILKRSLGTSRLNLLLGTKVSHPDPVSWIQDFVERLMLKRLQGGSATERAIGAQKAMAYTLATPNQIISAAKATGSPAAWRIVADFVPRTQLSRMIDELSGEQWRALLSSSEIPVQELRSTSDRMLSFIQGNPDSEDQRREKTLYYKNTLLDPVLDKLNKVNLGDDDQFLGDIERQSPEFAALIREHIWTPKQLDLVPDTYLEEAFRRLTMEDKAAVLIAMPTQQNNRLTNLLPQGNMRIILLDQIAKAQQKQDPRELRKAVDRARKFLNTLKQDAENKRFVLKGASMYDPTNPSIAQPRPAA